MAHHPVQTLLTTSDLLITASHTSLSTYSKASSTLMATSAPHTALIRLLVIHRDETTGVEHLIATGEDKLLTVSTLPSLTLLSTRELIKRANALSVTEDGTIVVGDKFGDVYTYPLIAPVVPAPVKGVEAAKAVPILGHVSMLNALVLVPATSTSKALVVTGDREEHIRVSRFPRGHIIERFLWGSSKFVSALLHIPSAPSHTELLLSAGGDATLQTFDFNSGALLSQVSVEAELYHFIIVASIRPGVSLINQGKKQDRKARKQALQKGKAKAVEGEVEAVSELGEEEVAAGEGIPTTIYDSDAPLPLGLAVTKIIRVGEGVEGGFVILASGCTALLYVPFTSILPSLGPSSPSFVLDLKHPVLDVTVPLSSSPTSFNVSLDLTKGASARAEDASVRTVVLNGSTLTVNSATEIEKLASGSTALISPEIPLPDVESMYPVLSLLYVPEPHDDEGGDDTPAPTLAQAKKSNKRRQSAVVSEMSSENQSGHNGKRAHGRKQTEQRLDKEKAKASAGGQ